jgi:predicted RNase H-like HicB family nuclease
MTGREVLRRLVAKEDVKSYKVLIERDETGAWIARVPEVPGCHTYGRTLSAARRRIREALGLWIKGAKRARLDFDVRLPREVRDTVRPYEVARRRAETATNDAQEALRAATARLVDSGLSLRDAGDLLGLSHQRIAQVKKRRDLLGETDRYLAELTAEVGEPTPKRASHAEAIVRGTRRRRKKAG